MGNISKINGREWRNFVKMQCNAGPQEKEKAMSHRYSYIHSSPLNEEKIQPKTISAIDHFENYVPPPCGPCMN